MPERLIPVAAWAKAWVCSRWLAEIVVLNSLGAWMSVSYECCQVEVSAMGQSLILWCARGYFTCYSPMSGEQATSKRAMPITCRSEKAGQ
jgi:hypothetical protein